VNSEDRARISRLTNSGKGPWPCVRKSSGLDFRWKRKSCARRSGPSATSRISAYELTTWDFTLSVSLPVFFWQPLKGEIAEAQANLEAFRNEQEHVANTIALEVEESCANALLSGRQIELFEKDILPQAEEAYHMFLFSFEEGEIGGIELIEARRTLIEARKSYADALNNFNVALAALAKSVGQDLEEIPHD
jgi:outer membrane protein TolC